jgi:two-component system KDP operon response regulator KdpE
VLVVDDDPGLLRVVEVGLHARGYDVVTAIDGRAALDLVDATDPDVVILDLGLPDMDGLDVERHLRARSTATIVVLSADGAEERKVAALEQGADDYLTKPFSMAELIARLGVAMRHRRALAAVVGDEELRCGALQIDVAAHAAAVGGAPLELTPKEFALLTLLVRNAGKVLTHKTILERVWGPNQALDTLRTHVSQLRRKLGEGPDAPHLVTEPGVGYRLVAPEN